MENNDQLQVMELKKAWSHQFLSQFSIKKIVYIMGVIFFPWIIIKELRYSLKKMRKNNIELAEKVSNLRSTNAFLASPKDQGLALNSHVSIGEIAGLLNWPEVLVDVKRTSGFWELIRMLSLFAAEKNTISNPSNCWLLLATKNCDQLLEHGYANFKRTIGHNYFNFLIQKGDSQIHAVESLLPEEIIASCRSKALSIPHDPTFLTKEQFSYYYFVLLLWEYVKSIDKKHYLDYLQEPKEGNPLLVSVNDKSMSQDLANSLIEYYSVDNYLSFKNIHSVLEIGSGYGRNAHVILTLNPTAKVILVDILPALYIAQRYLSSVFKERKVFRARQFSSYAEVKEEMESASIIFLLPSQLTLLPEKSIDLSMNISSFGEMNLEQIKWYFNEINRLTRQAFYTKQWDVSKNPFDNLELSKNDYPYLNHWEKIYSRHCAVQNEFFETLYRVNPL